LRALAQSYAEALVEVSIEKGKPEQAKRELAGFLDLLAESADLRSFLASPAVPATAKHVVIDKLVARLDAGTSVRNLLCVVVDNHRSALLADIYDAFALKLNARLGIAEVQVNSARALSEPQKAELTQALERLTGKKVEARYRLEPELIGGALVQIGSTIYDGSVRDQLKRLRARLTSA
jgi:F-type H+-transporting ATPase subunit delta